MDPFEAPNGYGHTSAARKRKIAERRFLDSDHGPSFTPLSFVRLLSDQGYVFDMVVSTMEGESSDQFYQRRWRVEFIEAREGLLRGVGEAPRKLLAKEAAAMDLLQNIKLADPSMDLPKVKMQKGPKISPSVVNKLTVLCQQMDLELPKFATRLESDKRSDEVYKTTVSIGQLEYTDSCRDQFYSKLQAAVVAYNNLSGKQFPLYGHFSGKDCHRKKAAAKLYGDVEVEQLHVVNSIKSAKNLPKLQMFRPKVTQLGPLLTKIRQNQEQRRRLARSSRSLASTAWTDNPYSVISSSTLASRAASVQSIPRAKIPEKRTKKTHDNMIRWASCIITRPQQVNVPLEFAKFGGSSSTLVNSVESGSDETLVGSSGDELGIQKEARIAKITKKRFMRTESESSAFLDSD